MIYLNTVLLLIVVGLLLKLVADSRPRQSRSGRIVIDTSVLMDGRVLELAKAGFLSGTIVVPSSVVMELQQIADGSSSLKRERARYGLDVLREIQSADGVEVHIVGVDDSVPVDDMLRQLAKKYRAFLMTNDFNLAKVASLQGIRVLNINELAQGLRPVRLPGEKLTIKIVQKGAERDQGVGYMEDGTMVVVDRAAGKLHRQVDVTVTRTLQTAAGKMCFAELAGNDSGKGH
jgi:uncharacterized protein YacL